MTISISNITVNFSAPPGTVVGVLIAQDALGNVVPCTYTLTKASAGYFGISGNKLVTAWSASPAPGYYSVRIRAVGTTSMFSGSAKFAINVVMSAPPEPSLMMPGIIISLIFHEQGKLVLRATPLQN